MQDDGLKNVTASRLSKSLREKLIVYAEGKMTSLNANNMRSFLCSDCQKLSLI